MYWVIFLKILDNVLKESKTRNFIIAVILLLLTYLLIVFLTERDDNFRTDLPVSNMENTKNSDIGTLLKDELYVIQNITEEDESYEINIYYPYTTDEKLNSYINTKLELYKKDIKFQASNYENEIQEGKYKLNICFNVTKSEDKYISFIFYVTQDIKYLHPQETIFVINYDKTNKKILLQEDLEKMFPNLYYNLSEYTYNQLLNKEEIKNMGTLEMLESGTRPNKYNFMDAAFKDNSLLVLFEKYQIAPYVLGYFEVEVPMGYLNQK